MESRDWSEIGMENMGYVHIWQWGDIVQMT